MVIGGELWTPFDTKVKHWC